MDSNISFTIGIVLLILSGIASSILFPAPKKKNKDIEIGRGLDNDQNYKLFIEELERYRKSEKK